MASVPKDAVDLRSDTVTRPTEAMRDAMRRAPVGDDVYGDDPTVNALQERVAALLGFEVELFVPSGTQSNLIALLCHCQRGDEYLVGQQAHTYRYEAGGAAVLGSIQPQPIEQGADGRMSLDRITAEIKPDDPHFARTRLLALENTWHGRPLPLDYLDEACLLVRSRGLRRHLDGARLFNAAVATGESPARICKYFDSVSVCFSKGLGAPVGSVLCGDHELIEQARRWRKILGGGWRQAGVLAAACHHALDQHVGRLADDHARAERLGVGLAERGISASQHTNMVFVDIDAALSPRLTSAFRDANVLASVPASGSLRLVTHLDIDDAGIERVLSAFDSAMAAVD